MSIPEFIEVYENAISDEICDSIIKQFEDSIQTGASFRERSPSTERSDSVLYLNEMNQILVDKFNQELIRVSEGYREKYPTLKNLSMKSFTVKVQKTEPSEGYHHWHCEQSTPDSITRIIVWSVFLNDVDEGGETEFLYQKRRVKASKGNLLIFPASYTHTHRGNPPLSNTKYIATGWFYLY
tara:strand:- start:891 stop:1436 length:546 start_codon:yes stop_codon:yes gene_type:complete